MLIVFCFVNNSLFPACPVPVGGDVNVEVQYVYRSDSTLAAAFLTCHVSRGSFPFVSWLVNNATLPSETQMDFRGQQVRPLFALTDWGRTLVLAKLDSKGFYQCRARDRYDDSSPWVESGAVLVQVKGEDFKTTIYRMI